MIFLCGLLRNHHGGHLAVAVDIHDELPGAFAHAGTAGSTLLVVDNGHIVYHGNRTGGAVLLAQAAANAANGAVGLGHGALVLVAAGHQNIGGVGHIGDDVPGTDRSALHAVGAFMAIHLGHAVLIDVDGIKLAGLHTGAQTQASVSAVQCTIAGDLHSSHAVVKAHISVKLVTGPVAAGAAHKGHTALHRRNLYQFIEDWARIAIDFMAAYYGVRPVAVFNHRLNQEEIIEFDFSTINTAALDIKIDIGGSSYWSELTEVKTLDNLFLKEMISAIDYIDLMPESLMPHKQKAMANLRAREAPAAPAAPAADPQQQMMNQAMGMSEEMPLQEPQTNPSPIAPTAEDLLGLTQLDRVNATVAKTRNL